jgi:HPt (histidine-containing phosphotransfer) domain-containing protein
MKGDRERCLAEGADGYITKPMSPGELLDRVDEFAVTAASGDAVRPNELSRLLLERFDGDATVLTEITTLFRQDCPKQLDVIRRAVADHNSEELYVAAHTLRGSAGNFGASPLQEALGELEGHAKRADWIACRAAVTTVAAETAHLLATLPPEELACAS